MQVDLLRCIAYCQDDSVTNVVVAVEFRDGQRAECGLIELFNGASYGDFRT